MPAAFIAGDLLNNIYAGTKIALHTQGLVRTRAGKYCRKTLTDQCFGTVGLSYNKFRPETASTRMFKKFALEFFDSLQNMADKI